MKAGRRARSAFAAGNASGPVVKVGDVLDGHVGLDLECLDRIYLNGYVPTLQVGGQVVNFLTRHRGNPIPSPVLLAKIGDRFRERVDRFAATNGIPVVRFEKGAQLWPDPVEPAAGPDCDHLELLVQITKRLIRRITDAPTVPARIELARVGRELSHAIAAQRDPQVLAAAQGRELLAARMPRLARQFSIGQS